MTRFDRHKNMSGEVLSEVMDISHHLDYTKSVSTYGELSNYIYGLYDGFLYKEEILKCDEFKNLMKEDSRLVQRILGLISLIEKYPTLN